jgi:hypothetical protein
MNLIIGTLMPEVFSPLRWLFRLLFRAAQRRWWFPVLQVLE